MKSVAFTKETLALTKERWFVTQQTYVPTARRNFKSNFPSELPVSVCFGNNLLVFAYLCTLKANWIFPCWEVIIKISTPAVKTIGTSEFTSLSLRKRFSCSTFFKRWTRKVIICYVRWGRILWEAFHTCREWFLR